MATVPPAPSQWQPKHHPRPLPGFAPDFRPSFDDRHPLGQMREAPPARFGLLHLEPLAVVGDGHLQFSVLDVNL